MAAHSAVILALQYVWEPRSWHMFLSAENSSKVRKQRGVFFFPLWCFVIPQEQGTAAFGIFSFYGNEKTLQTKITFAYITPAKILPNQSANLLGMQEEDSNYEHSD